MTVEALVNADTGAPLAPPLDISSEPSVVVETDDRADLSSAYQRAMSEDGANRDANGRFVSRNPPPDGASAGAEGVAEPASSTVAAVSAAPAHLPQSIKSHWDKYPPEAQAAIAAHTQEMDRKFGEVGKQLGVMKPIADKLMGAAQQFPEFKGFTPDQIADGALKLAAVQAAMERGPESAVKTILEVAKTYNVLPMLAQAFSNQPPSDQTQQITGLQQKIATLESQLSKASNPDAIRETVSKTLEERETEAFVRTFAGKDGVKEYWSEVEASIPRFIQVVLGDPASTGKSGEEILADAFDMAINAIPAVREKVRAAEAAKATAAARDPKRSEGARKAASINVKSSSTSERDPTEQEALSSAYQRAMAS